MQGTVGDELLVVLIVVGCGRRGCLHLSAVLGNDVAKLRKIVLGGLVGLHHQDELSVRLLIKSAASRIVGGCPGCVDDPVQTVEGKYPVGKLLRSCGSLLLLAAVGAILIDTVDSFPDMLPAAAALPNYF